MRALILLVIAVLAAIGAALGALAAAADSALVNFRTIEVALQSVEAQPDVQIAIALSGPTGRGIGELSYVVDESSDRPGVALGAAGTHVGTAMFLFLDHRQVLDLYLIDGRTLYGRVDFQALSSLFATRPAKAELLQLQAVYGGRWYRLANLSSSTKRETESPADLAAARTLLGSLESTLRQDTTIQVVSSHGQNGIEVSGSGTKVLQAVVPALNRFATAVGQPIPLSLLPTSGLGPLNVAFYLAPSGNLGEIATRLGGQAPVGLGVIVNHSSISIVAPPDPHPLPNSLKRRLLTLLEGLALGRSSLVSTAS